MLTRSFKSNRSFYQRICYAHLLNNKWMLPLKIVTHFLALSRSLKRNKKTPKGSLQSKQKFLAKLNNVYQMDFSKKRLLAQQKPITFHIERKNQWFLVLQATIAFRKHPLLAQSHSHLLAHPCIVCTCQQARNKVGVTW